MPANNSTKVFFDSYAHGFDSIYGKNTPLFKRIINDVFRRTIKIRYEKTLMGCEPLDGKSIIDIGCGPGRYSIALAHKGAGSVLGIDFSEEMLNIAKQNALAMSVSEKCRFECCDFVTQPILGMFDYAIVMGVMDYIKEPLELMEKVISATSDKAFFSFPADGGFFAWQRKLKYKFRCDLYMYTEERLKNLFERIPNKKI